MAQRAQRFPDHVDYFGSYGQVLEGNFGQKVPCMAVPRPRLHLNRYHGVLAPNATLRARVVQKGAVARGPAAGEAPPAGAAGEIRGDAQPVRARAQRIGWARLLERVLDIDLRRCPGCGAGEFEIIAAILERAAIGKSLTHLGLDPRAPPRGRAREAGHAGYAFAAD